MAGTNRTLILHDNNTKFLAFKKSITPNKVPVYIFFSFLTKTQWNLCGKLHVTFGSEVVAVFIHIICQET